MSVGFTKYMAERKALWAKIDAILCMAYAKEEKIRKCQKAYQTICERRKKQ